MPSSISDQLRFEDFQNSTSSPEATTNDVGVNIRNPRASDITQFEKDENGCTVKNPPSRTTAATTELRDAMQEPSRNWRKDFGKERSFARANRGASAAAIHISRNPAKVNDEATYTLSPTQKLAPRMPKVPPASTGNFFFPGVTIRWATRQPSTVHIGTISPSITLTVPLARQGTNARVHAHSPALLQSTSPRP